MACQRDSKVFHVNCPFVIFEAYTGFSGHWKKRRLQEVDNTDNRLCKQNAGIEYVNTNVNDKKDWEIC